MKILAFAGKRRAGKTMAADMVKEIGENMGMKIKKRSFLFSARQMYAKVYGSAIPENDPSDQQVMNLYTYLNNVLKQNRMILANMLFKDVLPGDLVVIDDVKTIEDVQAIKARGGIIYKIDTEKPVRERRGFIFTKGVDDGMFETEIADLGSDTFRALGGGVLYNNKQPHELRKELEWIVRKVFITNMEVKS